MNCTCGGVLLHTVGITGYYPIEPRKCNACGQVTYVDERKVAQ